MSSKAALQASQHCDSQAQIKNYNSAHNFYDRASASQQHSNSSTAQMRTNSQSNKLFSRLQLRRAKEAAAANNNNNPNNTSNNGELLSFSERQT